MTKREAKIKAHFSNIAAGLRRRGATKAQAKAALAYLKTVPDKGRCLLCYLPMRLRDVSLDHDTPVSRGGGHGLKNLRACHRRCNNLKGSLTRDEFQHLRVFLGAISPDAAKDIGRRLISGGRVYRG